MRTIMCVAISLAGSLSLARAAEPVLPNLEWQPSAENVATRVAELVEYGKASGDSDARLADAVGGLNPACKMVIDFFSNGRR